jgi:tetratricopeptide (TPR) repeat protein
VCPKDALYVGAGKPSLFAAPRRALPADAMAQGERYARLLLLAAFIFGATSVLLAHNGDFDWPIAGVLAALSFGVAYLFRGKARRAVDYSLAEEATLGAVFIAALFTLRNFAPFGLTDGVPLLCTLGASAIVAYFVVQVARTAYRSNLKLQRIALHENDRMTVAGYCTIAALVPLVAFMAYGGAWQLERRTQLAQTAARSAQARVEYDRGVALAQKDDIEGAIAAFARAVELDADFTDARENLAGMLCAAGRFAEGVEQYLAALRVNPDDADTHALLGQAYLGLVDSRRAEEQFQAAVRLQPDHVQAHLALARLLAERGDEAGARLHSAAAAAAARD